MSLTAPQVPDPEITPPPLTVAESAKALRVSPGTVRNAISRGEIHAIRFGHIIRIPQSELARLLGGAQ